MYIQLGDPHMQSQLLLAHITHVLLLFYLLYVPLTLASRLFNLTTHSTRTMLMSRVRRNMTARMADTAMVELQESCLPAEAASCMPPAHSRDRFQRRGWEGDALVDAIHKMNAVQ